jgi:hypothetical protein
MISFGGGCSGRLLPRRLEQELHGGVGLCVARELEPPSIGRGDLDVEHLHSGQLVQGLTRREPQSQGAKSLLQSHLQEVSLKRILFELFSSCWALLAAQAATSR